MAIKNLLVRGGADFSGMKKEMSKAQNTLSDFQKNTGKIMKGIGVILGGISVGKLIKDSTAMAMGVESAIGNINRNMGSNAKTFQSWANTQAKAYGIAKSDAYKYGSTFSNLLASFTKGTGETASQTQELMKAAAIIASKTGRSYEDTAERIRSGMLGSTEAIEDLGVYTNISMIQSTEAFKKFANGKSWAQLDFQTQQQIRLAAILEQTYSRYGDTLADTTQTRQAQFIASLKNIQLSLGQAFLPIYNFILPALTVLANTVGKVFGYIAQFTTAIFGKVADTQKQTQATIQQAKATTGLGKASEKAGKQAKKAGKESKNTLAGFDEINSLNKGSSGAEGGGVEGIGAGGGASIPPLDTGGFASSTVEVSDKVRDMADKIKTHFNRLKNNLLENKDVIASSTAGILAGLGGFAIITNWSAIITAFSTALTGIGTALTGISLPILAVSALVALLVGNIVYLWRTNEKFRKSVIEVWDDIKTFVTTVVSDMWAIIKGIWDKYGADIMGNLAGFMKSIQDIILSVWEGFLKPVITGALEMLKWLWDKHLKGLVQQVGEFIAKLVNGALEIWNKFISPIVNWLIKVLGPVFANVFNFITDIFGSAIACIADVAKGIFKILGGIIDFIVGVFTGNWKKAWGGVKDILKGVWDSLVGIVKYPLNLIIDAINFLIRGMNKISIKTPDWVPLIGGKKFGISIPTIPKLAQGGYVGANNPMLAMIGDNKTEGEIVAPESKIYEQTYRAVKDAFGGGTGDRPLTIILRVGKTELARVVADGINDLSRQNGELILDI